MERTEAEKVTQEPITVKLGGKEYEIILLVIRDSRKWRKKIINLIAPLPSLVSATMDDPDVFKNALLRLMVVMPDKVIDLFFEYAKDLPRDEIEETANDTELAVAFDQVVAVAFPLVQSLPKVMARLSQ